LEGRGQKKTIRKLSVSLAARKPRVHIRRVVKAVNRGTDMMVYLKMLHLINVRKSFRVKKKLEMIGHSRKLIRTSWHL